MPPAFGSLSRWERVRVRAGKKRRAVYQYLLRRLLITIPTVLGINALLFSILAEISINDIGDGLRDALDPRQTS